MPLGRGGCQFVILKWPFSTIQKWHEHCFIEFETKSMLKSLAVLMVLTLGAMLICPALPAMTPTQASHPCQEKPQKNSGEKIHVCCDQQAVTAKSVMLHDESVLSSIRPQATEIAFHDSSFVPAAGSLFDHWKPYTLSTLTVLRI